jgi:hypothetical protein
MIQTDTNKGSSIKDIRERERKEQETQLRDKCQALAYERYGEEQVIKWSNQHKGLWYLPVMDESGENIEAIALMKPINRHILSYASTKITDEGLYAFLEQCMRECFIAGDQFIIDDDEYFIPAAMKFNAILEGKKAALLKR